MRFVLLAMVLVPSVALAEPFVAPSIGRPGAHARRMENPDFAAYQQRRTDRREQALVTRRVRNSQKVHVYRTAIAVPYDPVGVSAIQRGWVIQPPIPRRYTFWDWLNDYTDRLERAVSHYDIPRL